jgi:tetratricopeptide (TPR) repeat protein
VGAARSGPVTEFCAKLDELRIESGADVPLLAKRLGLSRAQLYAILGGRIKQPPEWDHVVRPLIDACTGGDPAVLEAWRRRHAILTGVWEELRRRDRPMTPAARAGPQAAEVPQRLPTPAAWFTSRHAERPQLAASRVVPHQLPATVRHFAGRSAELAVLTGVLDQAAGSSVAVISGSAGVGKTTLAVHWAHQIAARFPDGQLYVDLRGYDPSGEPAAPAEAMRGFLDTLGVTADRAPARLDQQASLYRSLLDGRRMLVVLDNASDAAQVRALLPGSPTCAVLVTSRNPLTGLLASVAARTITLDVLPLLEARDLLAARLGTERLSLEPDAVSELVTLCACLPLALSIVAARAAVNPAHQLAALVAELNDSRHRLDALDTGDAMMNVRAVFSWSYQRLSPGAARLFRLIGLHPGPDISISAAASLAGLPVTQARPLLTELASVHLLTEQPIGRFGYHDLLRAYAAELAGAEADDHAAALLRVLDHYLGTARAANMLLYPSRGTVPLPPPQDGAGADPLGDPEQAGNWLRQERLVLLGALAKAAELGLDVHAWQIAFYLARFFDFGGYWDDWARAQEVAVIAAARLDDANALARTHLSATYACLKLGEEQQARTHATRALELFERRGDRNGLARAHLALHKVHEKDNDYAAGFEHVQYALILYWATANRTGLAIALDDTGFCHAHLGNLNRALSCSKQALHLHRETRNRIGEAGSLDSLGYAHHLLGDYHSAIEFYQRSFHVYSELSAFEAACVQVRLGDTYLATGNHRDARAAWQAALTVLATVHHQSADRIRVRLAYLNAPAGPRPVFEPIATA